MRPRLQGQRFIALGSWLCSAIPPHISLYLCGWLVWRYFFGQLGGVVR